MPPGWIGVLRWAGLPLSVDGPLHWGREVAAAPRLHAPAIDGDRLLVPGHTWLEACTGVALRPLRRFVAERFGLRLQAAPGIAVYLWANQGILVSMREEPLGGFLHGPRDGERQNLTWAPGQALWVRWEAAALNG